MHGVLLTKQNVVSLLCNKLKTSHKLHLQSLTDYDDGSEFGTNSGLIPPFVLHTGTLPLCVAISYERDHLFLQYDHKVDLQTCKLILMMIKLLTGSVSWRI